MLEKYFSAAKTLARLRSGLSGPYIDGFAEALEQDGYSPLTAVRYLRAAAHFGHFLRRRRSPFPDLGPNTLEAFLGTCPAASALCCEAEVTTTILALEPNGFTLTWSKKGFTKLTTTQVRRGRNPN